MSTQVSIINYLLNYRVPGWTVAIAVLVLIVAVKYLMT